ncbi:MAG TPA: MarR family transcriptional regulator [Phycisphaerae bacterium]|nr:MarR family transcriptional regulator [Phycisphaerae bacterium]
MSTLAREIKKRDPFESPEQEAMLNLVRTAARVGAAFEPLFRAQGLCGAHYNVLRILAGEKSGGVDGLPVLEVRDRLITPVPDITRLVDKLVRQKLVRRERTEKDRRVVLLRITDRGQKLVDRLRAPVREVHLRQLGHMNRAELATLTRLLEKARSAPG